MDANITDGPCNLTDTHQYFMDPRIAKLAANGILSTPDGKFYIMQGYYEVVGQKFADTFAPVEADIMFRVFAVDSDGLITLVKIFNATGAPGTCYRYAVTVFDQVVKNCTLG